MKNLAVIVAEANEIERLLIESGGMLNDEIEKLITINNLELADKVDGYDIILERFETLKEHYKARAEFFSLVSRQCGNIQTRLKDNIKYAMVELGSKEIEGNDIRFALSKTKPKLVVDDEEAIPREFFKEAVEIIRDNEKLRKAMEVGPVPGVHLEESFALRTYANKKKIEGPNS